MSRVGLCVASLLVSLFHPTSGLGDILSDLTAPSTDVTRALELKSEQFWQPVLKSAEEINAKQHAKVYADVEAAISLLPKENEHVRGLLVESLDRLQRADEAILLQAASSAQVAQEQLFGGAPSDTNFFSFLTGGQNFLSQAIRRFVGEGDYAERLLNHIQRRQADVLPMLRGAASVTGDVLKDTRTSSKLAFDVMKYDIYNRDVPKTPSIAKNVANKLVDAAGESRRYFMRSIIGTVDSLSRDVQGKDRSPSEIVTSSLLAGLEESPFEPSKASRGSEDDSLQDESVKDLERVPGVQSLGFERGIFVSL
eukprot:TRINITY_DN3956_c0_g1_i2.p1 TRINITY_DN3956_c0_g1~~TRINITY_DN3956_c0_g1_i2.p1  ORF type:complete len:335 (+),score=52.61 TRINITY_DN3956_c0_g1_i2:76-1005(+)